MLIIQLKISFRYPPSDACEKLKDGLTSLNYVEVRIQPSVSLFPLLFSCHCSRHFPPHFPAVFPAIFPATFSRSCSRHLFPAIVPATFFCRSSPFHLLFQPLFSRHFSRHFFPLLFPPPFSRHCPRHFFLPLFPFPSIVPAPFFPPLLIYHAAFLSNARLYNRYMGVRVGGSLGGIR